MITCKICGKEADLFLGNGYGICNNCFNEHGYYSTCASCGRYFYIDLHDKETEICPMCKLEKKKTRIKY